MRKTGVERIGAVRAPLWSYDGAVGVAVGVRRGGFADAVISRLYLPADDRWSNADGIASSSLLQLLLFGGLKMRCLVLPLVETVLARNDGSSLAPV